MDFYLEHFAEFICSFNINKINLHLNLERKYNNVSKDEFIFTLSEWFKELKNNKNNVLKQITSTCTSGKCCNNGCEIYVFESDVTREYIALKFDVFQNRIINITECSSFNYKATTEANKVSLKRYKVNNWEPSNEYEQWIKELFPSDDFLPSYPEMRYWIEKLSYNYVNPNFHEKFKVIWNFISDYCKFYKTVPTAEMAMYYLKKINSDHEYDLLEWLVNHEKTYAETLGCYSFFESFDSNKFHTIIDQYKVDISSICIVKEFEAVYWKGYKKACEKYSNYISDQKSYQYNEQLYQGLLKLELLEDFESVPIPELAKIKKDKFKNYN